MKLIKLLTQNHIYSKIISYGIVATIMLALSGCSGGDSGKAVPSGPGGATVTVSASVKTINEMDELSKATGIKDTSNTTIHIRLILKSIDGKTTIDMHEKDVRLGSKVSFTNNIRYNKEKYVFTIESQAGANETCNLSDNPSFSLDPKDGYNTKNDLIYACSSAKPKPHPTHLNNKGGWPSYLAMGSITDDSLAIPVAPSISNGVCSFAGAGFTPDASLPGDKCAQVAGAGVDVNPRPVNAIFKYEGTGQPADTELTYPLSTVETIIQANKLHNFYTEKYPKIFTDNNPVVPVMVIYTANFSYGEPTQDFSNQNLKLHFMKLIMAAHNLQSNKNKAGKAIGSVILNPDFLGKVQQKDLVAKMSHAIEAGRLNQALSDAINQVQQSCKYDYRSLPLTGHKPTCATGSYHGDVYGLYNDLLDKCSYGYWNAAQDWASLNQKIEPSNCAAAKQMTVPPHFDATLAGWVQATNWIMTNFAPGIPFGWQENIWATNESSWPNDESSVSDVAQKTTDFIHSLNVYTGNYRPDFIVLDRYEFDDFHVNKIIKTCSKGDKDCTPCSIDCAAANQYTKANNYLYNARNWDRYLDYAGYIGKNLKAPVMLWQIPGGHMQTTNDIDQRARNGGTAPNFFFGEKVASYDQLKPYIFDLPIPTDAGGVKTQKNVIWWRAGSSIKAYLQISPDDYNGVTPYDWSTRHLDKAASLNVFSILWGGGNTTGVADLSAVETKKNPSNGKEYTETMGPGDDGGWLSQKILEYLQSTNK